MGGGGLKRGNAPRARESQRCKSSASLLCCCVVVLSCCIYVVGCIYLINLDVPTVHTDDDADDDNNTDTL